MSRYVNVKGFPGLVRHKSSGAIININSAEMQSARQRKQKALKEREELQDLKSEVTELKDLVKKLLEEKDGNYSN
tara:strand:+ start:2297 stop:2521 length:225 start_codon:yes stop_codon:yes gene_type:complete